MLRKIFLAGAASTFLIGAAQAADIEALPEAYDWSGAYIGLQAGYAWDNDNLDAEVNPLLGFPIDADDLDPDGFVGGVHLGYLMQSDALVFGIEGDIEYADINDSAGIFPVAAPAVTLADVDYDIDWLGSVRLRAGYAWDRVLLYATGGLAVGGVNLDIESTGAIAGLTGGDDDDTKWGWTIGGGLDYAIWDDVSLRIEYRYTDLGKSEADVEAAGAGNVSVFGAEVDNTFHAVRGGLSWRFR